MDFLKELFGDSALTYEQFAEAAEAKKLKIADLSGGKYIDKQKYDDDIAAKDEQINTLNGKIKTHGSDIEELQNQIAKQAYEFAVKEFAGGQKFTSGAAKREFINTMIGKGLKMESDKILGADDFLEAYKTDNADSFITEKETKEPKPNFAASTSPKPTEGTITKEQFAKMGYSERNALFAKNRELYDKLTKE